MLLLILPGFCPRNVSMLVCLQMYSHSCNLTMCLALRYSLTSRFTDQRSSAMGTLPKVTPETLNPNLTWPYWARPGQNPKPPLRPRDRRQAGRSAARRPRRAPTVTLNDTVARARLSGAASIRKTLRAAARGKQAAQV